MPIFTARRELDSGAMFSHKALIQGANRELNIPAQHICAYGSASTDYLSSVQPAQSVRVLLRACTWFLREQKLLNLVTCIMNCLATFAMYACQEDRETSQFPFQSNGSRLLWYTDRQRSPRNPDPSSVLVELWLHGGCTPSCFKLPTAAFANVC